MSWLVEGIRDSLTIALMLLVLAAALAPFESLGWWAGWSRRWPGPLSLPDLAAHAPEPGADPMPACYLVYLSGVGAIDPAGLTAKERNFLDLLAARVRGATIIDDVFPYSAANTPLTGPRRLRWFWRWVVRLVRRPQTNQIWRLIALRNSLQIAVSADSRYGPVYSFGIARAILLRLLSRGYRHHSRTPIILLGLSGGGQVAVGAAARLRRLLQAPVWVVSIGGVLTSDPSIAEVEHLFHLAGSRDRTQYLGLALYPGCWPIMRNSAWNRALAAGKRTVIPLGPMGHMGHGDYLSRSVLLPDGQSHVERTVEAIAAAVGRVISRPAGAEHTRERS